MPVVRNFLRYARVPCPSGRKEEARPHCWIWQLNHEPTCYKSGADQGASALLRSSFGPLYCRTRSLTPRHAQASRPLTRHCQPTPRKTGRLRTSSSCPRTPARARSAFRHAHGTTQTGVRVLRGGCAGTRPRTRTCLVRARLPPSPRRLTRASRGHSISRSSTTTAHFSLKTTRSATGELLNSKRMLS